MVKIAMAPTSKAIVCGSPPDLKELADFEPMPELEIESEPETEIKAPFVCPMSLPAVAVAVPLESTVPS